MTSSTRFLRSSRPTQPMIGVASATPHSRARPLPDRQGELGEIDHRGDDDAHGAAALASGSPQRRGSRGTRRRSGPYAASARPVASATRPPCSISGGGSGQALERGVDVRHGLTGDDEVVGGQPRGRGRRRSPRTTACTGCGRPGCPVPPVGRAFAPASLADARRRRRRGGSAPGRDASRAGGLRSPRRRPPARRRRRGRAAAGAVAPAPARAPRCPARQMAPLSRGCTLATNRSSPAVLG